MFNPVRTCKLIIVCLFLTGCTLEGVLEKLASQNEPIEITLTPAVTVTQLNQGLVPLHGECAPEGMIFEVTAPSSISGLVCVGGQWGSSLDLSALSEGQHSLSLQPESGTETFVFSILKDTTPPQFLNIEIEGGSAKASSLLVGVEITGTDIHEVYLTESSGCLAGGTWVPYQQSSAWTLSMGDGEKKLYFKARDQYGNESSCIEDSIVLDTTPPTVSLSYVGSATFYSASFTLRITPSEPVTGLALSDFSVVNASVSNLVDQTSYYTVTVTPAGDGLVQVGLNAMAVADNVGLVNDLVAPISRTYDSSPSGYIPMPKQSDDFAAVYNSVVYVCDMTSASSCVALPPYVDVNAATVTQRSAKLLLNGDVLAAGDVVDGTYRKAIVSHYSAAGGTWTELDRFSFHATTASEGYVLAVSPSGSVAMVLKSRDANNYVNFVTRELLTGSGSWQTVDFYHINGTIGTPTFALYTDDESLLWSGTLYDSSVKGTGVIRHKDGITNNWSTVDQYVHTGYETTFNGIDVLDDKVFIVGWIGTSPRQMLVRDCVISTKSCSVRRVGSIGGVDTYPSKVITSDGEKLFIAGNERGGPSGSIQAFQASYVITSNSLTVNHNYQVVTGNLASFSGVGMATDGKIWGFGYGYNGSVYRPFLSIYASTGVHMSTYSY